MFLFFPLLYFGDMKSILIPTDFSQAAHYAFLYGLQLAKDLHASVTLLHVFPPKHARRDIGDHPMVEFLDQDLTQEALAWFSAYEKAAQLEVGASVPLQLALESGNPVSSIVHAAKEASLVVMGSQGYRSQEEKVFGSVATQVIQETSCPVLTIPSGAIYRGVKNIMYASSNRTDDQQMIEQLAEYAQKLNANLSFVHIQLQKTTDLHPAYASVEIEQKNGGTLAWYDFTHTDVQAGLGMFIQENSVDWVAMLKRRQDMWDQLFSHSHTRQMALHTQIPLLTFLEP